MCAQQIPTYAKQAAIDISIVSNYRIPPQDLYISIAAAESKFNQLATSPAGAYGVFQIMPITEKHINERLGLELSKEVYENNILIGIEYFEELYIRAKGNVLRALAMYNYGPTSLANWERRHGRLSSSNIHNLPEETYTYIKRIRGYRKLVKERKCER